MEKEVLFISDKKSMIGSALIQALEEAAFRVIQVKANVTDISRMEEKPKLWLLFMQGAENRITDVMGYLRDQVEEFAIRLFVIGTPQELEENLSTFPPDYIKGRFTRPFRMEDVVERFTAEALNIQRMSESKRVLVIDDDPVMLTTLKDLLSGAYRVYTANSGMAALQMLVTMEVDLILLDYEMPVINGPQILEMLRSESHTRDIPVMFLTSKNDRQAILRVMELGPANYLLKSLPQTEILQKIKEFFEQ